MHYMQPKRGIRGDLEDGLDFPEGIMSHMNDDSKDSMALKGIFLFFIQIKKKLIFV